MHAGNVERTHLPNTVKFCIAATDDHEEMRTAAPSHRLVSRRHGVHGDGAVPLIRQWSVGVMQDNAPCPRSGERGVMLCEVFAELGNSLPMTEVVRVGHDRTPCHRLILFMNAVLFMRFTTKYRSLPITVMLPCASS